MGKSSLKAIAVDHFDTLKDANTGHWSRDDLLWQVGLPLLCALGSLSIGWYWRNPSSAVAGVSIVAALLCSMAVFLFQLRLETHNIVDDRLGDRDYALLDQTFFNVMWAIVVGLALALFLIVCEGLDVFQDDTLGKVLTAIAVFASAHFLTVIGMSLKRLRRAYERIAARKR